MRLPAKRTLIVLTLALLAVLSLQAFIGAVQNLISVLPTSSAFDPDFGAGSPPLQSLFPGPAQPTDVAPTIGPRRPDSFGTDVRISNDNLNQPRNEFFGAYDPTNPLHFLVGANDYHPGPANSKTYSGAWYTTDGGLTWAGGNFPCCYPGGTNIFPGGDIDLWILRAISSTLSSW